MRILVEVEGDEVVRVRGDADHPLSKGYTCAKGRALPQVHHHPDRSNAPWMRRDGACSATTWDDALDDLGEQLRTIIDKHGPAVDRGLLRERARHGRARVSGWWKPCYGAIGTPAKFSPLTIDGTAKPLISDLVGGFMGFRPDGHRLRRRPDALHRGQPGDFPRPHIALRTRWPPSGPSNRAEVWVLDPLRTETARLATGHLAPRPGTDHAVLAYLSGRCCTTVADEQVLADQTTGRDELARAVEPFTLEHAADFAGPRGRADGLLAAVRAAGASRSTPGPASP